MTGFAQRSGILAAGNWVIDRVKLVDLYPPEEALALIQEEQESNGGSPYNLLKDLRRLGATFPLQAAGLLAEDRLGRTILADCEKEGIDVSHFRWTTKSTTSYTDVVTVSATGRRTFFHRKGTNALLGPEHFDLNASHARIFHLGYLLLLDRLDKVDSAGRTGASRLLEAALREGFRTSVDVVSSASEAFGKVVRASLPYVDYFFANDLEAERIAGIGIRRDGQLVIEAVVKAGRWFLENGVRRCVCIHFPEGAFVCDAETGGCWQGAVKVPKDRIAGSVGAGDAFAAGMLFGLHEGWGILDCLRLAVGAAAACLFHPTASLGVLPWKACLDLGNEWGYRELEGRVENG